MASPPTWVIDAADERGVPTRAYCDACGFGWRRPAGDDWADTLAKVALFHRRVCNKPTTPTEGV